MAAKSIQQRSTSVTCKTNLEWHPTKNDRIGVGIECAEENGVLIKQASLNGSKPKATSRHGTAQGGKQLPQWSPEGMKDGRKGAKLARAFASDANAGVSPSSSRPQPRARGARPRCCISSACCAPKRLAQPRTAASVPFEGKSRHASAERVPPPPRAPPPPHSRASDAVGDCKQGGERGEVGGRGEAKVGRLELRAQAALLSQRDLAYYYSAARQRGWRYSAGTCLLCGLFQLKHGAPGCLHKRARARRLHAISLAARRRQAGTPCESAARKMLHVHRPDENEEEAEAVRNPAAFHNPSELST
eukprot:6031232-Pleurochrysis_carterae.AAC.2